MEALIRYNYEFRCGIIRRYKPLFVFSGRQLHYPIGKDDTQAPLDMLVHCYFYHRDVSDMNTCTFLTVKKNNTEQTAQFRQNGS